MNSLQDSDKFLFAAVDPAVDPAVEMAQRKASASPQESLASPNTQRLSGLFYRMPHVPVWVIVCI